MELIKEIFEELRKKDPIQDVLDANFKPETSSKDITPPKTGVMYKSMKLKDFLDQKKLKKMKKDNL